MRILVVNDDGIEYEGIIELAALARDFGEVYVVAPASQCSAMSHKVTVTGSMHVTKVDFPVEGVHAYSVTGTPADCVKVGVEYIMDGDVDLIFSGINDGYNIARDIIYSGTVGAAMDGVMHGVKSIAYSLETKKPYDVIRAYFREITEIILKKEIGPDEIWNVNFPGCEVEEVKGILFDREPDSVNFYNPVYTLEEKENGDFSLTPRFDFVAEGGKGTDIEAVLSNHISVSRIRNLVP